MEPGFTPNEAITQGQDADFIVARHSIKPKGEDLASEEYAGISEKGVELAREEAHDWIEVLQKSEDGTVLLLSPTSELVRAKSSMRAVTDGMKQEGSELESAGITIITENEIAKPQREEGEDNSDSPLGFRQRVARLVSEIESDPDGKFVVSFPMFIKEFAMGNDRWLDENGKYNNFTNEILSKHDNNEEMALRDWIENEGHLGELEGPNPTEVAKEHLDGIRRLAKFARKYLPNRPIIIGGVGHSWNLDVLAVYLANGGKVDMEGYQKTGSKMIDTLEPIKLNVQGDKAVLEYGDRFATEIDLDGLESGE